MKKIFLIFFICIEIIYAHPHFFLDSKIIIKEDKIKNEWIFDRLNSRVLLFDFDKNKNKIFDKNEKNAFIKTHFSKLKENNYNIFLTLEDEIKIEPKNIQINQNNDKRISLSFDIDIKLNNVFTMCTIDEKLYMAYKLIEISSAKKLEVQKSEYDYCIGVTK
ncbi:DUF1007 family protein [Arcobacter sp. LA11]|uniref:DUF1007 family protein n=1 Tax=Arcobacter sp. LA11 TaxID=1898176 RepID=UPI0009325C5E|nr:DUF1007 family protein [Arcobacter sp. LA11]